MSDSSDTLFVEMAVAKGYLDRPTADEAQSIERATREDGSDRRLLRDILVEEGWMSAEQVAEVDSQIEDGSEKTGKIEGYKLLAKVGQGGMGAVYKAERIETGEQVALKILPRRMAQKQDFVERFLREARSAGKMHSEYIVRPVDVGFSGGYYYFAMEYVDGESVETTLSIDGPTAESKALRIIHQMAQALRDAEHAGMVHRDIKPGNILITEDGIAKLTDFGLAREAEDHSVTQTGVTLGTPNYMSPEQAKAMKSLDIRSDIYSLGVTFYHMVTGTVPFQGETSMLTMLKHLNEPPVAPINRRPELSRGCNDVILKMLAKDRDNRYRNANQLIEDLDLVMVGKPPKHAESTEPVPEKTPGVEPGGGEHFATEMRRHDGFRWLRVGVALFVAALIGVVAYKILVPGKPGAGANGGAGPRDNGAFSESAKRERIARNALKGAKQYAAKYPTLLPEIVRRYADVEEAYRPTSVYEEARELRAAAERALAAAIKTAFAERQAKARRFAGQKLFGQALGAFDDFPAEIRTAEAMRQVRLAKKNLSRKAWDEFYALRDKAHRYLKIKKLSAARATVLPAREFGIAGIATEAEKVLAEIDGHVIESGAEKTRRALEAYQVAVRGVRAFVRAGLFSPALRELSTQRRKATDELVRDLLAGNLPTIITARSVWAAVLTGAARLKPGYSVQVGTVKWRFLSYDARNKKLQFRTSKKTVAKVSPGWLPPDKLRELAVSGWGGTAKPVELAAFFLARGEYAHAAAEVQSAKKAGVDPQILKRYEEHLTLLQKGGKEIDAENLLDRAREQVKQDGGHEQAALSLWEIVSKYTDTKCYAANRQEIEGMLAQAEAQGITLDTLFAVKPTPAADGLTQLDYDFSDFAQGRDWLTVWKKTSFGRWPIRPVDAEMAAERGRVYFKVPVRGDYDVVVKVRDVRAASIRFGMPTPAASPLVAGYSFNWARTPAGGAVSSVFASGKRVGQDKKLSRFQFVRELELSLHVRRGVLTAKAGDRMSHRVQLRPAPAATDPPTYLILDGFNTGARVTAVTLRFKQDRDWLEKHFVEPLRRAKLEEARWRMTRYQPLLVGGDAGAWRLEGPPGVKNNGWTFARGYAIAPEKVRCTMTAGDQNWRDYAFAAKVRIGSAPGGVRLMVRWADVAAAGAPGQGYFIELTAGRGATGSGGKVALGKIAGARTETLKEASVDLSAVEWYPVYIEVRGPRLRVLIGGDQVVQADDATHRTGRVGLASFLSGAQFSDIKIKVMK